MIRSSPAGSSQAMADIPRRQEAGLTLRPPLDRAFSSAVSRAFPTCFDAAGFHHSTGRGAAFLGNAVPARATFLAGAATTGFDPDSFFSRTGGICLPG